MPATASLTKLERPDIVIGDEKHHQSRKAAKVADTKARGGTVSVAERAAFGGKEQKKKCDSVLGSLSGKRHDHDGGLRGTRRPAWLSGDVKVKKLDLHKYKAEHEAVEAVSKVLKQCCTAEAYEIVCGAGTHTQFTKQGKIAKETGDWKNKQDPLFFTIKKMVQEAARINSWIPMDNHSSSIYIRAQKDCDSPRLSGTSTRPCGVASSQDPISDFDTDATFPGDEIKKHTMHNARVSSTIHEREDVLLQEFAALKLKQSRGSKLSNKDTRQLEKLERRCKDIEQERLCAKKVMTNTSDEDPESDLSSEEEELDSFGNTISVKK